MLKLAERSIAFPFLTSDSGSQPPVPITTMPTVVVPDSAVTDSVVPDMVVPDSDIPQSTGPGLTVSDSAIPVLGSVNSGNQPCTQYYPLVPPQTMITASSSPFLTGILEWSIKESQADIMGRAGSNACVFIALYMGKFCVQKNLTWPTGNLFTESWQTSLKEAMIKGNLIHDDLFDQEGINVMMRCQWQGKNVGCKDWDL